MRHLHCFISEAANRNTAVSPRGRYRADMPPKPSSEGTVMKPLPLVICLWLIFVSPAMAGKADVIKVDVSVTAPQTYTFAVTVQHADTGWKHYADRWQVLAPDGTVLGTRVLYHPHVEEQPFTRTLSGVQIPARISRVTIQAHDSVHGWGGKSITLAIPRKN